MNVLIVFQEQTQIWFLSQPPAFLACVVRARTVKGRVEDAASSAGPDLELKGSVALSLSTVLTALRSR